MDLVTIIVPVYNVESYLVRCIDSIISQTYKNLEILLIDDGSTDKSGEICDNFTDNRIKVIHQRNGGVSAARNKGLDNANGDWVMFVDSDDFIHSDMVEVLMHLCRTYNSLVSKCGIVRGTDSSFPEDVVPERVKKWEFHELYSSSGRDYRGCVWGGLFCRSLFEHLRFPIGKTISEDEYAAFFAMYQAGYVTVTNRHMYYYYMSPVSALRSHKKNVNFDVIDTYEDIIAFLEKKEESNLINLAKKELCIRAMMNYIGSVRDNMPEIDQQKLLTVFREYYTQIDLSRIPTKEKLALILFKSMPHMFTFLENRLDIIHGVKLAREKK